MNHVGALRRGRLCSKAVKMVGESGHIDLVKMAPTLAKTVDQSRGPCRLLMKYGAFNEAIN